jgi:NADPH2:quinone reductase
MKEAIVHPTPELHTTIHEVPIPEPGPDELVIKVIVAGSNPKGFVLHSTSKSRSTNLLTDWDHLTTINKSLNSGDDIGGIVHSFGSNVQKTNEFKIGDRVAAFHPMMAPHGAFAEYAVAPQHTILKIPDGISFEGQLNITPFQITHFLL